MPHVNVHPTVADNGELETLSTEITITVRQDLCFNSTKRRKWLIGFDVPSSSMTALNSSQHKHLANDLSLDAPPAFTTLEETFTKKGNGSYTILFRFISFTIILKTCVW